MLWPRGDGELPGSWERLVDVRAGKPVEAVQACIDRGRPFGEAAWVAVAAREMGLEASLRMRGRPRKEAECVEG